MLAHTVPPTTPATTTLSHRLSHRLKQHLLDYIKRYCVLSPMRERALLATPDLAEVERLVQRVFPENGLPEKTDSTRRADGQHAHRLLLLLQITPESQLVQEDMLEQYETELMLPAVLPETDALRSLPARATRPLAPRQAWNKAQAVLQPTGALHSTTYTWTHGTPRSLSTMLEEATHAFIACHHHQWQRILLAPLHVARIRVLPRYRSYRHMVQADSTLDLNTVNVEGRAYV